jgi:hypothetical protein
VSLGKRVYTEVDYVLAEADDAVDRDKSDISKYNDSFERKYLKLKKGKQPTIFKLRPMSYRQRMHFESIEDNTRKFEFALRCGIWDIQNYIIETQDGGNGIAMPKPVRVKDPQLGELLPESWIEEMNLPPDQIVHVGAAVITISQGQRPKF